MIKNDEPTPSLPVTDEEIAAIDEAISGMSVLFRRSGVVVSSYRNFNTDSNKPACDAIDKIIEKGIDRIRPALKKDFVEKLADRLAFKLIKGDDEMSSMGHIYLRLLDTLMLVIAVQKKYRGREAKSPYSEEFAKSELKVRGLWKR